MRAEHGKARILANAATILVVPRDTIRQPSSILPPIPAQPPMPELAVEEITKEYPTRAEALQVLRGVSLRLGAGENVAILGPSGSGKSTLLYIIGTLERPTTGTIRLDADDPLALEEARLAEFRSRRIGFVFQDHHLLPQCNVLDNVLLPTLADGSGSSADVERAKMLLDRVGLSSRLDHRPAELSGGERQASQWPAP